jgi:transcriptional regulator with XRE-family HTH domain
MTRVRATGIRTHLIEQRPSDAGLRSMMQTLRAAGGEPLATELARSGPKSAVGRFLAGFRNAASLTSRQLAEKLGWKQPQVTRLEGAGGGLPKLETLKSFIDGCDGELALVGRDAAGRVHVCAVSSDSFAKALEATLRAEVQPAPSPERPAKAARSRAYALADVTPA